MNILNIKAYAKINIGLEILHKRQDGYHEINTIFSRIPIFDEILISKNNELIVECIPSLEIPQEKNIVYKVVQLLKEQNNKFTDNIKITIKKNIPHGAGLGGGSSDAASVLKGLNKFWNLNLTADKLKEIANELGSDVAYFLDEGTAIGTGRGESLDYFDYAIPYNVLLVFPGIKISTKWAYDNLNIGSKRKEPSDLKKLLIKSKVNPSLLKIYFKNDFESIVFKEYPFLAKIKNELYGNNAIYAQLSGSGSTLFGFYETNEKAEIAKENLKEYQSIIC